MNRIANAHAPSPELQRALKTLKRLGYAVGQPTLSNEGRILVTVGGKVLAEEQVLECVQES